MFAGLIKFADPAANVSSRDITQVVVFSISFLPSKTTNRVLDSCKSLLVSPWTNDTKSNTVPGAIPKKPSTLQPHFRSETNFCTGATTFLYMFAAHL